MGLSKGTLFPPQMQSPPPRNKADTINRDINHHIHHSPLRIPLLRDPLFPVGGGIGGWVPLGFHDNKNMFVVTPRL